MSVIMKQAEGNEWKRDLLFEVPREHREMQRLDGRYKKCVRSPWRTCCVAYVLHES